MEVHRNEIDEAVYQLMMDVQTGRMINAPRRSRLWILVGCVTVVLGGLGGLLLASGNRTHEMAGSNQALAPNFMTQIPQVQPKEPYEGADLVEPLPIPQKNRSLAHEPPERPHAAAVPPSSGRKAGPKTKGLSSASADTSTPKPESMRPRVVSKSKRGCSDCPRKDWSQKTSPQRSFQPSSRSLAYEFDPNGELVRSTP
jgi:hypothetical protein